jgi:hypothetical protein
MYVLMLGNLSSGFRFIGPFHTETEAKKYGKATFGDEQWMWVEPLLTPTGKPPSY